MGMSGGVDSSVAAYLLKRRDYNVVGVFMRSYNIDGCAETDAEDARRVAGHLGIPFYTWDFEEEYKKRVVEYMVQGYRNGLTPNPDVMCNREIKFGLFYEKAMSLGADYVATGHYVKVENGKLYEAKDKNKDQSYFLWAIKKAQLKHCLFPIGDYLKPQVREIARKARISTAEKKDSQGICFLGKVSLADFLKQYIPERKGIIITSDGQKIGEHDGVAFYTIGQRHGLDLKTKNRELGIRGEVDTQAHYIASKNVKTNTLVVAEGETNGALYQKEIMLGSLNLFSSLSLGLKVLARVRYRQKLALAEFKKEGEKIVLSFNQPQKFVAPGQSAVFYSEHGEVLGGGVII